jgi:hypothetical protein
MKLRFTCLAFLSLLLMAALAGAAPVSASADTANASLAAIFSAPGSTGCDNLKLPSLEPAPTDKAVQCGSCSDSLCQGKHFRDVCKVQGGKTYLCQPAYVVCAANDCECWTGPLP